MVRNVIETGAERVECMSTGAEIVERLKRVGIDERDIATEPPQGEEEFQKELKRKSTILTP